jgi:predicted nucleic acid-binding protein
MIFLDTWAFKAYIDIEEYKHNEVANYIENLWKNKEKIVTTDYIIDETITLLSSKLSFEKVIKFIEILEISINKGFIHMVRIASEDFDESIKMRIKYKDKPKISFTDFTSMVIMKRYNINDIVTQDKHFKDVGIGFNPLFI